MIFYIIFIILAIIILYKKICYKTIEGFSENKTNIVFSNRTIDDSSDKYANVNQEILVISQDPGMNRIPKFKYFRGPLYEYIALYSRIKNSKNEIVTVDTKLVQIAEINYDIMQLFGQNGALINDNFNQVNYYLKVLDKKTYEDELKKDRIKKININNYNQCVNLQKLTSFTNIAVANCKTKFKLN